MDDGVSKGMGQHYVNMALLGDAGGPRRGQARRRSSTTSRAARRGSSRSSTSCRARRRTRRRRLLGQTFTYQPMLGVWKLHYWIWRANPDGIFKDFSPKRPALRRRAAGMSMHH